MTKAANIFANERNLLLARAYVRAENMGTFAPEGAMEAYETAAAIHGEAAVLKAILAYTDAQPQGPRHAQQVLSERLPHSCAATADGRPAHQLMH